MSEEKFIFKKETHEYFLGDRKLENITSIIDGFLSKEFFTEESRIRGTAVHEAIKSIYQIDDYNLDIQYQGYIDAFLKFLKDTDFKMILSETPLYHPFFRYAGTPDLFGMMNGKETVVEIKTGANSPVYQLQTAAQQELINSSQRVKCNQRRVLQLNKDSTYRIHIHTGVNDIHVFKACLTTLRWKKRNGL